MKNEVKKIKRTGSLIKSGNRLTLNIPATFIEILELQPGNKNLDLELDIINKTILIKLREENENEK